MTAEDSGFEVPEELPLLPLRELVVFPYMVIPLFVGRARSIAALEDALASDRLLLLVAQRNPEIEEPGPDDLYRVGTVAMVMRTLRLPDGRVKALVQGLTKARIDSFVDQDPSSWARVSPLPADEDLEWCVEAEALMRTVRGRVEELLPLKNLPPEVISVTANVEEPGRLADLVASHLRLRLADAQEVLETLEPLARLRKVDAVLRRELEVSSVQAQIQSQAKEEMTRGQREHFLREQLRAIQTELGEVDTRGEELDEYRLKIEEAALPEEAHTEAMRQLRRLERMHPDGPEAQVVRGYLDWVVELPWSKTSPDQLDLLNARRDYDGVLAYAETKRAQVVLSELWAEELRDTSVVVNAMHPGWADTPSVKSSLPRFHRLTRSILRTPAEGADTVVWLAASSRARRWTGRFFLDREARRTHLLPFTREYSEDRRALWKLCERLCEEPSG